MKEEFESFVYYVYRVLVEKVCVNSYNLNYVVVFEMKLLELSIWEDGYIMFCVCYYIFDEDIYELVDGYYCYCVFKILKCVFEWEKGLFFVVVIEKDFLNRMVSIICYNCVCGIYSIELMVDIVVELIKVGMSDEWIKKNIGMDVDEFLWFK